MSFLPCLEPSTPAQEALGRLMEPGDIPGFARGFSSWQAMEALSSADPHNAIRLIAGWLSTREAVWWGALCMAQLSKAGLLNNPDKLLLEKVVTWVKEPTDRNRDAVGTPQHEVQANPVSLLAAATALTSNNISPDPKNPVTGPSGLPHRLVAHAVLQGSERWPGGGREFCLAHFIQIGLEVSDVKILWLPDALPPHPGLRQPPVVVKPPKGLKNIWDDWN